MVLWPQWRSPLIWDVFAVSTYATVSLLFWYVGLIPDLAALRDRATTKTRHVIYGVLSLVSLPKHRCRSWISSAKVSCLAARRMWRAI
jgi:molybdopterin-containing oxidoreductase family membrane subunit